jgi:hypothetical protein
MVFAAVIAAAAVGGGSAVVVKSDAVWLPAQAHLFDKGLDGLAGIEKLQVDL